LPFQQYHPPLILFWLLNTPIYIGFLRDNLAKSSIFLVYVAENKIPYLSLGKILIISFNSSSKPYLSKASASSIIKHSKLEKLNPFKLNHKE
jgi:hypothetical protein